jgi:hypothetical protein
MTEPIQPTTTPTPETEESTTRGYFNQAQLDDLKLAQDVLAAAGSHAAAMDEQDITAEWLAKFKEALAECRLRSTNAGQEADESEQATAAAIAAAKNLTIALQAIQASAKQKHQMLAEDGDPATNFPLDGYLIGSRIDANRSILIQSANTLITRAKADSLPGHKSAEKIAAIELLLKTYEGETQEKVETSRDKELARLDRDSLLHLVNSRRTAVQHAADAIWPAAIEATRPIHKTFSIPMTHAMTN